MSKDNTPGDRISAVVTGPVQGQVAVGKGIDQRQQTGDMQLTLTQAQRAEVADVFATLRDQVAATVPEADRPAALDRVAELEEAVTAAQPDLTTVDYVKQWFARKLPTAAGLVASVLVHPLIGAIVQRAGERLGDAIT